MMWRITFTTRFKRDYKRLLKRGFEERLLQEVLTLLQTGAPLPYRYRDHALSGDYAGFRECHLKPDCLLVYRKEEDVLVLTMVRMGTHSDLF